MTTDLEDRIRSNLHDRARRIVVDRPPLAELSARRAAGPRPRRVTVERVAVAAALVAFVAGGVVVVSASREGTPTGGPAASSLDGPTAGSLGELVFPGVLVAMPEPWRLDRFQFVSAAAMATSYREDAKAVDDAGNPIQVPEPLTRFELNFTDGVRRIQINFSPAGGSEPTNATPDSSPVEVRGAIGNVLHHGNGSYEMRWSEAGRTWEVNGDHWSSAEDLAEALGQLELLDEESWADRMPAGLAAAMMDNPAGTVMLSPEYGLHATAGALGPAPTVPPGS
jgi:hypothetical protein